MISVLFALFVIATVSLNLNREGAFEVRLASDKLTTDKAKLTAQAGMNHLLNQATARNCTGYSDIVTTAFDNGTYTATILPAAGSPVSTFVNATMDDGSYAEIARTNQIIYQPSQPELSITTAEGTSGDTKVSNSSWFSADDRNYSTDTNISVGDNILWTKNYALLNFDLASIPSSVKVLSAILNLNLKSANKDSDEAALSVHRILSEWDPTTVTYNTSDGSSAWSWPDLYATESDGKLSFESTISGPRELNLTHLVQQWVDGSEPANGMVLVANDQLNSAYFSSAEDSDPSLWPTLEIRYTCECGLNCENTIPLPVSIAHWKLDESSGTTAYDSIGPNDGTTSGTNWVSGQVDGGAYFNGSSDYIKVAHADELSFDQELSISAWIYLEVSATGPYSNQTIIGKGTSNFTDEFWLGIWENEIEFGILDSGDWFGVNTVASGLQIDTWHHVVITFSDATDEVLFYLDGAIVANRTLTKDYIADNEAILIGTSQYDEYWYGMLDDIRLFEYIITPEEVAALASVGDITATTTEYVLDKFDIESFSGDDGSISWSGDWQEVGESDGFVSGDVRVASVKEPSSGLTREFVAIIKDNDNGGEGIQREANLQSCSAATLVFEYIRVGFDLVSTDYVSISVSNDGGSSWEEIDKIDRSAGDPGMDPYFVAASYDITKFISKETVVRFKTSPSLANNEWMALDNIEIRLTGCK